LSKCCKVPGAAQSGSANSAGRGGDICPGCLRQAFDERRTCCTCAGIATPQPQFAVHGERTPDRGKIFSFVFQRRN
jgi:hypothetical protein